MKPELELGISNPNNVSFKAFRLRQRGFRSHWHYHPELELVFFVQGNGMRFIGDDISLYTEGNLFLIGKSLPHTFVSYEADETEEVEALCIQFPHNLLNSFPECNVLNTLFQEANRGIAFPPIPDYLIGKIRRVVAGAGIDALLAFIDLLKNLYELPGREPVLQQPYQRHAALAETTTRIQEALDFINVNYWRPISLHEMAGVCHFSPNAFCRWFKQNMGLTFIDYLNKVRLTHVCQLLIATDYSVGQIAERTGFDNISTLNRLFQQKLSTSPGKYRGANRRR